MAVHSHAEAVEMVLGVLRCGGRSDRWLRLADDGGYFTTPDTEFLRSDGSVESPPAVRIPVASDCNEIEEEEWADALIRELDALAAAATD